MGHLEKPPSAAILPRRHRPRRISRKVLNVAVGYACGLFRTSAELSRSPHLPCLPAGRLYVTDLSYNFVEQPFPQVMKFVGDPDDATTPGAFGAAELGTSGLSVDAAVNETAMLNWLRNVTVNQHDASTPGNPQNDCSEPYTQRTGAVTSGDLIPIDDFLSGWAQMTGAHTGQSPTLWISSGLSVTFDGLANRPLTASMSVGSNDGVVIYSSYHTAHTCPTIYFWPQERVLQYMMQEAF